MAALGKGLSGSDRIFIELARNLQSRGYQIAIYLWEDGLRMCKSQMLEGLSINYRVSGMYPWKHFGFFVNYLARIVEGIRIALTVKMENSDNTVLYSASEFWMDSVPAFILKLRFPKAIWAAAWFQTAPNPILGFTNGKRQTTYRLSALCYYLMQLPVKPLIEKFADFVLINNEEERNQFPKLNKQNKVLILLGAVNVSKIKKWIRENGTNKPKNYDAVFQGRFHPQKGVVELIEIWKLVTKKLPEAKLAMIGDGPLMKDVQAKIDRLDLGDNVKLLGYVFDGPEKYNIFSKSKIVLHPAFYDSGGMAAAEAMAFGLPGVSFDLSSLKSYYPQGMLKVRVGNLEDFAAEIIRLLTNQSLYNKLSNQAIALIGSEWNWENRTDQFIKKLGEIKNEKS